MLGALDPGEFGLRDLRGEPARRLEEARDVVVAAYDERARRDFSRERAQVGRAQRLAGERIALARAARERSPRAPSGDEKFTAGRPMVRLRWLVSASSRHASATDMEYSRSRSK